MAKTEGRGKGGKRKIGRSFKSPAHQRYTAESRWVKNRRKKIARHIKRHPNDMVAKTAVV
jgi:hypothetical protein